MIGTIYMDNVRESDVMDYGDNFTLQFSEGSDQTAIVELTHEQFKALYDEMGKHILEMQERIAALEEAAWNGETLRES